MSAGNANDSEATTAHGATDATDATDATHATDVEAVKAYVNVKPTLPMWKLCLVASPQFGIQSFWTFMGAAMLPYLGQLGFPAWAAPLLTFAGPITGFFTDPIVGAWSDRNTSRFGRRRPVIISGFISTLFAGFFFAACPRLFSGPALLLSSAVLLWVLDTTINLMQTPIRALIADLCTEEQSTAAQVIVTTFQGLGAMASFAFQMIWENPSDHIFAMFALMIGVNALCVSLMLLVTTETPFVLEVSDGQADRKISRLWLIGIPEFFRPMLHVPKFLLHLGVVQTLVWLGIAMMNKNGSMWFGVTLFEGQSRATAGSPEKIAFDHGIAAFSAAGLFQSLLMVVASLLMIMILLKTRVQLRVLYAACLSVGALGGVLAFVAVGHSVIFAQVLVVVTKIAETSTFVVPYGLVAMANKRAEENGEDVNTAMQMSLLNCYCTLGQLLSMAVTSLFRGIMPDTIAFPALLLLGGICQGIAACAVMIFKNLLASPSGNEKNKDEPTVPPSHNVMSISI